MPYNGSGGFTRVMNWQADAAAGTKIKADRHDQEDDNLASGLSNAICKDGQSSPTADIPMNSKKITNLANPVNPQDGATKAYVDGVRDFSSAISITGSTPESVVKFTGTTGPWGDSYVSADLFFGTNSTPNWYWHTTASGTGGVTPLVLSKLGSLQNMLYMTNGSSPFIQILTQDTGGFTGAAADNDGGLVISSQTTGLSPNLILNKSGGGNATIWGTHGASRRWAMHLGDIGENFIIRRYDTSGVDQGNVMSFGISDGLCTIYRTLNMQNFVVINASAYNNIAAGGLKISDGTVYPIWHGQPASLVVDFGGEGLDHGAVWASRTLGSHTAIMFLNGGGGTQVGSITNSTTATSYLTSSDIRLKEGMKAATGSRAIIDALQVVEWQPEAAQSFVAVEGIEPSEEMPSYVSIPAQQAYTVYPPAVGVPDTSLSNYNAETQPGEEGFMPWGIDHSKFVPSLIGNVQENNSRLDALETRIAALETTP